MSYEKKEQHKMPQIYEKHWNSSSYHGSVNMKLMSLCLRKYLQAENLSHFSPCTPAQFHQGLLCPLTESMDTRLHNRMYTNEEQNPRWYLVHVQVNLNLHILCALKSTFSLGTAYLILYVALETSFSITELPYIHHETRLYHFDPLKPHFYIVKLRFTGL